MHFVYVERGYPRSSGEIGGAGMYVRAIALELIRRGHSVSVICGKDSNRSGMFLDKDIEVYPEYQNHPISFFLQKFLIFNFLLSLFKYFEDGIHIRKILKIIDKKKKIDFIEYSEGGDFWTSLFKDYFYISHLHGSSFTFKKNSNKKIEFKDWIKRKAELFFIKNASLIISPSKAMANLVKGEMKLNLKISIIPYPVRFIYNEKLIIRKKQNNLPVKLIFASRNDPIKGGELLINSLRLLDSIIKKKIEVSIYGYIPMNNYEDLSFLKIFKFISHEDLKKVYLESDICVIPSIFDNSPNTVYEAMAYGKIVVASNIGGISEIINDPKNGYLFRCNDCKDLSLKISNAVNLIGSGESLKMSKNAINRITDIASLKKNVDYRLSLL